MTEELQEDDHTINLYWFPEPLCKVQESESLLEIITAVERKGYSTRHLCQTLYHGGKGHLQIYRGTERQGVVRSKDEEGKVKYQLYLMVDE